MRCRQLFVHALSPIHVGVGQSFGGVDLPILREGSTGTPLIPGSSLKGVLRARARERASEHIDVVFGPPTDRAHENAGAMSFGDAFLLLLPVRSMAGTFAWVTSSLLLGRLARDVAACGDDTFPKALPKACAERASCRVAPGSSLLLQLDGAPSVLLEDLDFAADEDDGLARLGDWLSERLSSSAAGDARLMPIAPRLCLVHDDVMAFLAEHATQIVTRVALDDETRTVLHGPWQEEALPTETVLAGLLTSLPSRLGSASLNEVSTLCDRPVQIGGGASIGRGWCRLHVVGGGA